MLFANIIVDLSVEKLDKPFGYIIPEKLEGHIQVGSVVLVPFGKGNRTIQGFVIEITDYSDFPVSKMKSVLRVCDEHEMVISRLIKLAAWIRRNYGSTMNQALKTVLPVKTKVNSVEKKFIHLKFKGDELTDALAGYQRKNAKAKLRLMEELAQVEVISREIVVDKLHVSSGTISALEKEGAIEIEVKSDYRNPISDMEQPPYDICLNEEQKNVADTIKASIFGRVESHSKILSVSAYFSKSPSHSRFGIKRFIFS